MHFAGLLEFDADQRPLQRSRAVAYWVGGTCNVYVNLAGREPGGVVPRTEFERIRERIVAAFTAQVPNARLYLPTEKDFARIDTGIFIPAIQSAEQNGNAADALKSANDQLNSLLGCK